MHLSDLPLLLVHIRLNQVKYPFVYTPGLSSTSFSMYYTKQEDVQEWSKCLHFHLRGGGILRKSKCYTELIELIMIAN